MLRGLFFAHSSQIRTLRYPYNTQSERVRSQGSTVIFRHPSIPLAMEAARFNVYPYGLPTSKYEVLLMIASATAWSGRRSKVRLRMAYGDSMANMKTKPSNRGLARRFCCMRERCRSAKSPMTASRVCRCMRDARCFASLIVGAHAVFPKTLRHEARVEMSGVHAATFKMTSRRKPRHPRMLSCRRTTYDRHPPEGPLLQVLWPPHHEWSSSL